MFTIMIMIHVVICILLIIVVLMQSAKGEGLAGAFGGGALSGAVFGGRGAASFLSRATTFLAVFYMVSCLGLSLMSAGRGGASTVLPGESAVTREAQEDMQRQQEAAAQQQATEAVQQQGEAAEDIFNIPPAEDPVPDSQ
ncbi:MAG: preprotein translocase subunit SecG [candidate division Zixibacteria bacterium]